MYWDASSRRVSSRWKPISRSTSGSGGSAKIGRRCGGRLRSISGQQISSQDQLSERCPPHKFRELAICAHNQQVPHEQPAPAYS